MTDTKSMANDDIKPQASSSHHYHSIEQPYSHEMTRPSNWKPVMNTILVGIPILVMALLLGGTGLMFALSSSTPTEEERYQKINSKLQQIDYQTGGTILKEGYDDGGPSALNPAYFNATYEGTEVFEILKPRIVEAYNGTCDLVTETQLSCGQKPQVALVIKDDGNTQLTLTETGPGL